MKEKELRRSLAVFPIGSVMKLTDLTARQIRYYEDQGLIFPDRTEGNRRMYSLDNMDRLLDIADIKRRYAEKEQVTTKAVSQEEIRKALHRDIVQQSRFTSSLSPYDPFR